MDIPELHDLQEIETITGRIVSNLARINELAESLPAKDEFDELGQRLAGIRENMEHIVEVAASDDLPGPTDFEDLAKEVGGIRANLDAIQEVDASTLPGPTDFEDLAKQVSAIRGNLDAIAEAEPVC